MKDKLLQGTVKFKEEVFEKYRKHFEELSSHQNPHTLFIACSDSRVDPNMICHTKPGELFIIRNVANLVPNYRKVDEHLATTAAIEYAIVALGVEAIVVCGHSNCGGCNALFASDEKLSNIPNTKKWLELAKAVKEKIEKEHSHLCDSGREFLTEQLNVVEQIKHLLSYPYIVEKYIEGKLKILGWHYIIETGEIYNYNKETGEFELYNS
ncbi:MAG: carbonic anhydrase [Fusobacteria bacterium]|nr:carbonic anhydrase [Fusobacteriota bacterium]